MVPASTPLVWLHVGDLHITEAGLENHRALHAIVATIRRQLGGQLDFVFLPGDNADHGTEAQYRLIAKALAPLEVSPGVPMRIIPGDHDVEPGSLDAYVAELAVERLPAVHVVRGRRCLFLDIVSAGSGGPDFRLGADQLAWLTTQLDEAAALSQPVALFMHSYPADLGPDTARLLALLRRHPPALIEMGHTHYNELANDGRTIFAATRSTGQIEEGPVGFSLMALDGDAVSWRFQPLDAPWPLVMITSPPDHRLRTVRTPPPAAIRALVFGANPLACVTCRIDDTPPLPMRQHPDSPVWSCDWTPSAAQHRIVVAATSRSGDIVHDVILVHTDPLTEPPVSTGSDAHRIHAWPERHLLGTQLGPNRNGRGW